MSDLPCIALLSSSSASHEVRSPSVVHTEVPSRRNGRELHWLAQVELTQQQQQEQQVCIAPPQADLYLRACAGALTSKAHTRLNLHNTGASSLR